MGDRNLKILVRVPHNARAHVPDRPSRGFLPLFWKRNNVYHSELSESNWLLSKLLTFYCEKLKYLTMSISQMVWCNRYVYSVLVFLPTVFFIINTFLAETVLALFMLFIYLVIYLSYLIIKRFCLKVSRHFIVRCFDDICISWVSLLKCVPCTEKCLVILLNSRV